MVKECTGRLNCRCKACQPYIENDTARWFHSQLVDIGAFVVHVWSKLLFWAVITFYEAAGIIDEVGNCRGD
jgi:hypothetical protein